MSATTTCEICGTIRNETVGEHLGDNHPNKLFTVDYEPSTETGVIHAESEFKLLL